MATEPLIALAKKLIEMDKKLDKIEKALPAPYRVGHRAISSVENYPFHMLGRMQVELDWMKPSLRGDARIFKDPNGRVKIEIIVEGEDAAIVEDLIESQPVTALRLTSVEPR